MAVQNVIALTVVFKSARGLFYLQRPTAQRGWPIFLCSRDGFAAFSTINCIGNHAKQDLPHQGKNSKDTLNGLVWRFVEQIEQRRDHPPKKAPTPMLFVQRAQSGE